MRSDVNYFVLGFKSVFNNFPPVYIFQIQVTKRKATKESSDMLLYIKSQVKCLYKVFLITLDQLTVQVCTGTTNVRSRFLCNKCPL